MKLTRIDLNSWLLQLANQTILIDPWLIDPLVFYGQPWLFTAYHTHPPIFTPTTLPPLDLILISQGLDDHCHQPTLAQLDRHIPVIASPTAVKTLKTLGYSDITSLSNWQEIKVKEILQITAIPGAELQPGQLENGYLLKDLSTQQTLYYEPHQSPLAKLQQNLSEIDIILAPVIGQIFPILGQVIMGPAQALTLAQTLKPRYFVPTASGDLQMTGLLPKLIRTIGSLDQFHQLLTTAQLPTQLLTPAPGQTLELPPHPKSIPKIHLW